MVKMVSANQLNAGQRLRWIPDHKPRLLLVYDSAERLNKLRGALDSIGAEITGVNSIEELRHACRVQHCIAVVDIGPDRIIPVLDALRNSSEHTAIPVLVEASRISSALGLAGVLPRYRAMPCCENEILFLTRNQFAEDVNDYDRRGIL
jgi:hypothetical protein